MRTAAAVLPARSRATRFRRAHQAAAEPARRCDDRGGLLPRRRRRASTPRALFHAVVGTALVAGGSAAFNQLLERRVDALMERTRIRPVAGGRLLPARNAACSRRRSRRLGLVWLALGDNHARRGRRGGDARHLRAALHAAQAADVVRHRRRRHARRAAADDRMGGGDRHALARSVDALRDRLLLADAALPRHRVAVPRGLRARRLPDAAGRRTGRPQHGVSGRGLRLGARAREPGAERSSAWPGRPTSWSRSCSGSASCSSACASRHAARGATRDTLFLASIAYLPLVWIAMIADRVR